MPDGDVILPGNPRYRDGRGAEGGTGLIDRPTYPNSPGGDGLLPIRIDTGDVTINIGAPAVQGTGTQNYSENFSENLAEYLDDTTLGLLGNDVIQGVEDDITSRAEWIREYVQGVDLLGTKVEEEGRGGDRRRNVSRVGVETLLEAMVRYQARLALDTPVPTPEGWTTIGDIRPGDRVLDEQGKPVLVLGTSPIRDDMPCYRVSFDDGFSIVADEDHLWTVEVQVGRDMRGHIWETQDIPTRDLIAGRHSIWLSRPFDLPERKLPVHPYVLGLWLGDGDKNGGRITVGFQDYDETTKNIAACGHAVRDSHRNGCGVAVRVVDLTTQLKDMGLIADKHIPVEYMRASRAQREALVQGLMDSDGHINKITRQCTFANVDFELIAQVQELLKTVGIKSTLLTVPAKTKTFPGGREHTSQHYCELRFTADWNQQIFRLPRKRVIQEGWKRKPRLRATKRFKIVDVRPVRPVPVRCLTIDNESHLFLAGLGMVPTHNSAEGEMLPAAGPAKVPTIGRASPEQEERAKDFQDDFNFLLTDVLREYYPDTSSMLMHEGFCGLGYKKVYRDPIRMRPTSQSVIAPNMIVSEEATDLDTAIRVTHEIEMNRSTLRRMQICGHYLDIQLGQPSGTEGIGRQAQRKIKENQGLMVVPLRPQDTPYLIWETDQDVDPLQFHIEGKFEHKAPRDLPLPYKVTVDRATGKTLGVWRNWRQDDPLYRKRNMYVKYSLVPSLGYHSWGFLHLLGNQTRALRALRRIMINAGMFSQFPGGLKAKGARTSTTEVAPGPGEWIDVDAVMGPNFDISKLFMAMPYKDVSSALFQLSEAIKGDTMRLGASAQIEVGEGRTNVPVGTVMAMVEQQVQVMSGIHKRNHQSQKQELMLLRELFAEDIGALNRFTKMRPRPGDQQPRFWSAVSEFMDLDLQPASDPNVPSSVHRLMVNNALVMLAQGAPQYFDLPEVLRAAVTTIGLDADRFVIRPDAAAQTQQPDPRVVGKQAEVAQKAQEAQLDAQVKAQGIAQKQQEAQLEAQSDAAELQIKRESLAIDAQKAAAQNETMRLIEQQKTAGDIAKVHHQADRDEAAQWFEPVRQPQGLAGGA